MDKNIFIKIFIFSFLILLFGSCCRVKKTYYPKGNLESKIRYCKNKINGKAIWYYEATQKKRLEATYVNDTLHGEMIRYYYDGKVEDSKRFVKGSVEDTAFFYSKEGLLTHFYIYENSKKNGSFLYFYEDGQVQVKGNYKDNEYHGVWEYFDEEGFLVGEGEFDMGNGQLKRYNTQGNLVQVRYYKNSQPTGEEIKYDNKGRRVSNFHNNLDVVKE